MNLLERLVVGTVTGYIVKEVSKQYGVPNDVASQRGFFAGLGTFIVLEEEPKDTCNYALLKNGKRMYEGITYVNRTNTRIAEHIASGKIFTNVIISVPKTRDEAIKHEKQRIKRHRPKYNVHHNR